MFVLYEKHKIIKISSKTKWEECGGFVKVWFLQNFALFYAISCAKLVHNGVL